MEHPLPKLTEPESESSSSPNPTTNVHDRPKPPLKGGAIERISISILVIISLPLLYVSLLHVPPSSLFHDTAFWFLLSNSLVLVIAADSGLLFSPPAASASSVSGSPLRGEAMDNSIVATKRPPVVKKTTPLEPSTVAAADKNLSAAAETLSQSESSPLRGEAIGNSIVATERWPVVKKTTSQEPSTVASADKSPAAAASETKSDGCKVEESDQYSNLSDEELNRRVEDFIRRYYREMRLQLRDE